MLRRHFITNNSSANIIIHYISTKQVKCFGGYIKKGVDDDGEKIYIIKDVYNHSNDARWELFLSNPKVIKNNYYFKSGNNNITGYPNSYIGEYNGVYINESDVTSITEIKIPEGVDTLHGTFIYVNYDSSLINFSLPNSLVNMLGSYFIQIPKNMEDIIIPRHVENIGQIIELDNITTSHKLKRIIMCCRQCPTCVLESNKPLGIYDESKNIKVKLKVPDSMMPAYELNMAFTQYSKLLSPLPQISCDSNINLNNVLIEDEHYYMGLKYTKIFKSINTTIENLNTIAILVDDIEDISYINVKNINTLIWDVKDYFYKINSYKINISDIKNIIITNNVKCIHENFITESKNLCNSFDTINGGADDFKISIHHNALSNIYIEKENFDFPYLNAVAANYWGAKVGTIVDDWLVDGTKLLMYLGNDETVTIPDYITDISKLVLSKTTIKNIIIPGSVKVITNSFRKTFDSVILNEGVEEITNLSLVQSYVKTLHIPNSVKHIQLYSIPTKLDNEEIINGIRYVDNCLISVSSEVSGEVVIKEGTRLIADDAFSYNKNITKIICPNSLLYIGTSFNGSSITEIVLNEGLLEIRNTAFANCGNLTTVHLPNSLQSIGNSAFAYCNNLTTVTGGENIISIGENTFANTIFIDNDYIDNVKYLSNIAIRCTSSTPIIKEGTRVIAPYCFANNYTTDIDIPDSVEYIGDYAFRHTNLSYFNIPKNVKHIGIGVVSECGRLETITVNPENTIYDSRNNCNAVIETSSNTLIAGCKNTIFDRSVKNIRKDSFIYGIFNREITIPSNISNIENNIFRRSDVYTFDQIYTSIIVEKGNNTYRSDNNSIIEIELEKIIIGIDTIPDYTAIIGEYAFDNGTIAGEVIFPDKLLSIKESAFRFSNITSITLPASINFIERYAFNSKLQTVNYKGTINMFKNIYYHTYAFPNNITKVHCIDGDIEI